MSSGLDARGSLSVPVGSLSFCEPAGLSPADCDGTSLHHCQLAWSCGRFVCLPPHGESSMPGMMDASRLSLCTSG